MADSIISLLSPVASSPNDASVFSGKNGLAALFDGAGAQSDAQTNAFTDLLAKAGNANVASVNAARSTIALVGKATPNDAAQNFPIQPSDEVQWLQTTGEEVVAEPLPHIDDVQASEMAAIAFIPQVTMQLPEKLTVPEATDISLDLGLNVAAASDESVPVFVADAPALLVDEAVEVGDDVVPVQQAMEDQDGDNVIALATNLTPVTSQSTSADETPKTSEDVVASEKANKEAAKAEAKDARTLLELALEKQAKNAVVHKAKVANKKADTGNEDGAEQVAQTPMDTQNAASVVTPKSPVPAYIEDTSTTRTLVQKAIMEAPVALELQSQKGLKLKTKENEPSLIAEGDVSSPVLASTLDNALDALSVGDVALQQSAAVQTQVISQQAVTLDVSDGETSLNETNAVALGTPRPVVGRKHDDKLAANPLSQPRTSDGVVHDKTHANASFAHVMAQENAQISSDASFESLASDDSAANETSLQIGGDSTAPSTQAIGGDAMQSAQNLNDVRMSSSVQLRQTNLAYASVHEQIQVQVKQAVTQPNGESADSIRVRLNPIELGQLQITLKVKADGTTHVKVEAERSETLEMLQRDAKGLASALAEAGLQADAGSLEFSMSGEGRSGGEAQAQRETAGVTADAESDIAFGALSDGDADLDSGFENTGSTLSGVTQNYTVKVDGGVDIQA